MAESDVSMEYAAVSQAAAKFEAAGQEFSTLIAPLAAVGQVLAQEAFVGSAGAAAAKALEAIQVQLQYLVRRCGEMSTDILTSIQAYQTGDSDGADQFKN